MSVLYLCEFYLNVIREQSYSLLVFRIYLELDRKGVLVYRDLGSPLRLGQSVVILANKSYISHVDWVRVPSIPILDYELLRQSFHQGV